MKYCIVCLGATYLRPPISAALKYAFRLVEAAPITCCFPGVKVLVTACLLLPRGLIIRLGSQAQRKEVLKIGIEIPEWLFRTRALVGLSRQ